MTDNRAVTYGLKMFVDDDHPLAEAWRQRDVTSMRIILETAPTDDYMSRLMYQSVQKGLPDIVELLIEYGVDVDRIWDEDGETYLYKACRRGDIELIYLLLRAGAQVNHQNEKGETELHVACGRKRMDIVELLLAHGANPNVLSRSGLSPLYLACKQRSGAIAQMLVEHGADPNLTDEEGNTMLHQLCTCNGRMRNVGYKLNQMLRCGADPSRLNNIKASPLFYATYHSSTDAARLLLNYGGDLQSARNRLRYDREVGPWMSQLITRYPAVRTLQTMCIATIYLNRVDVSAVPKMILCLPDEIEEAELYERTVQKSRR